MRPINIEQKTNRELILTNLIREHPECITVNLRKLATLTRMNSNQYQILYRTYSDIKDKLNFCIRE